ncbi:unnamed protein product [Rhodiola kirilowii]
MSSSIGQSILMAITVTVNKYNSSNVQAVPLQNPTNQRQQKWWKKRALKRCRFEDELFTEYLKKSEVNKAKNDKERLDSYYKRNYKDYFEFVEGSLEGKSEQQLTESEKGIRNWLKANKN